MNECLDAQTSIVFAGLDGVDVYYLTRLIIWMFLILSIHKTALGWHVMVHFFNGYCFLMFILGFRSVCVFLFLLDLYLLWFLFLRQTSNCLLLLKLWLNWKASYIFAFAEAEFKGIVKNVIKAALQVLGINNYFARAIFSKADRIKQIWKFPVPSVFTQQKVCNSLHCAFVYF